VLPTRLIDVFEIPRLIETKEAALMPNMERYMTLSHCWGDHLMSERVLMTSRENMNEHQNITSSDALPQLFRDAIQVSRALNCRYIWIDALRIVQDNIEDWRYESTRMSKLYANAYFNLAATSLSNSSGSLFCGRVHFSYTDVNADPIPVATHEVTGSQPNDKAWFRIALNKEHQNLYGTSRYQRGRGAPLLDRAWVYQERLLSRRTVHVGASEVMWECRTCYFCECGEIGSQKTETSSRSFVVKNLDDMWPSICTPAKCVFNDICLSQTEPADVFHFLLGGC
jgi:hypothetical protein